MSKTKTISLPIDELPNERNGHKSQENVFQEEIGLSFESPSEIALNCSNREQLVKFEYHVLYHISYSVPYLCFNAYRSSNFIQIIRTAYPIKQYSKIYHIFCIIP